MRILEEDNLLMLVQEFKDIKTEVSDILWLSPQRPRTTGTLVIMYIPRTKKGKVWQSIKSFLGSPSICIYISSATLVSKGGWEIHCFKQAHCSSPLSVREAHRLTILLPLFLFHSSLFYSLFGGKKNTCISICYVLSIFHSKQDKHNSYSHGAQSLAGETGKQYHTYLVN